MAKKTTTVTSGQSTPASGQYEQIGPRGGRTGKEATLVKGNIAPPTEKGGNTGN